MKKILPVIIVLISNCASIGLVIQNKEEFALKPEKLTDKRIFIEYDLKMNSPYGVAYNKYRAENVSVRKSRMMQMKQSLENIIIENNTFTEYSLLNKTDKERDNSKFDYKIILNAKFKDSCSWYFWLFFPTVGLVPVRTIDTDYDISIVIQNSKGQTIYSKEYKNTYSFYLTLYTFLITSKHQFLQEEYFDYQMKKIMYDLNEKKLDLK